MNENYERIIAELLAENERLRASQNNKLAGDLTDTKIAKLTKRWTRDCENLYVQVSRKGSSKRSWIFKWTDPATGKVRPMGLGPYPDVSIAKARELALHHVCNCATARTLERSAMLAGMR